MFDKIRSDEDLKSLYCGCWLVKYPLIEQTLDVIDLSDERLFSLYEISGIEDSSDTVYLLNLDAEHPGVTEPKTLVNAGIISGNNVLSKKRSELISEGVWWYRC